MTREQLAAIRMRLKRLGLKPHQIEKHMAAYPKPKPPRAAKEPERISAWDRIVQHEYARRRRQKARRQARTGVQTGIAKALP